MSVDPNKLQQLALKPVGTDAAALQAALKVRNEMLSAAADQVLQVESDLRELRRAIRYAPMLVAKADGHLPPADCVFEPQTMVAIVPLDEGGDPAIQGPAPG